MIRGGKGPIARVACLSSLLASAAAVADSAPFYLGGNLEYDYRNATTLPGNSTITDHRVLGSLDAGGYLLQPWLATGDAGGTFSVGQTRDNFNMKGEADLLTGHVNLNLIPNSRFPVAVSYQASDNVVEWANLQQISNIKFGERYHSRFASVRPSWILPGGNRLEGFFLRNERSADKDANAQFVDNTLGLKAQLRGDDVNFYATGTRQVGEQGVTGDRQVSTNLVGNLGVFPGGDFYWNTLGTLVNVERHDGNGRAPGTESTSNGGFSSNADTATKQAASYFYWRPEYKPYSLTGGARFHQREARLYDRTTLQIAADPTLSASEKQVDMINSQYDFNANLAADYQWSPRLRFYTTGDISRLNTQVQCPYVLNLADSADTCFRSNNSSSGGSLNAAAMYQSDRFIYKGMGWYWYADGGVTSKATAQYEIMDWTHNINGGASHTGYYSVSVGNRGSARVSFTQGARQSFMYATTAPDRVTLVHTATAVWSDGDGDRNVFAQLSANDNREVGLDRDSQLLNAQFSGTLAVTRLSTIGGHLSAQSMRRTEPGLPSTGFLSTAGGRFNYNHSRAFGIYRLRFGVRTDISWIESQYGGARRQLDGQANFDYNIGRLSTALTYRVLYNEGAQQTRMVFLKISRGF